MSMQTRREREKQEMKMAILAAATKIIIEEGYDKLSMRKIADAIEYTPTTLYNYYKDKSQIIESIAKEMYMKIVSATKGVLHDHSNLPMNTSLMLAFKVFIYTMTDNAEMVKAVMRSGVKVIFASNDESALDLTSASDTDDGISILQSFLQEGQRQSIFRCLDENVAWMLITALLGFSMNAIENQLFLNDNWENLVDMYIEILVHGIVSINEGGMK